MTAGRRYRRVRGVLAIAGALGCSESPGPEAISPDPPLWASLDAGAAVTCGVSTDGRGYCWGEQWSVGRGGTPAAAITAPRPVGGNRAWSVIEAGTEIACGLTRAGETYCWGKDLSSSRFDSIPARLPADPGFASITVGDAHACGLTGDGTAYCWGDNFRGQTGAGRAFSFTSAAPVVGNLKFLALRAGPESTCGLVMNGDLYCWGGSDVLGEADEPRLVQQGFAFTSLAYGGNTGGRGHVCAQPGTATLYCFGYIPHELLPQPTPAAVALPESGTPRHVAVGGVWTPLIGLPYSYQLHTCAVGAAGAVSCWGTNSYGQLGDGTAVDRATPAMVPQLGGVTRVAAGGAHSCAVTSDGAAYCWGSNNRGQLGAGTAGGSETLPRQVVRPAE